MASMRLKISGLCVLLGGMAAALPQAQIQTGVTSGPKPPLNSVPVTTPGARQPSHVPAHNIAANTSKQPVPAAVSGRPSAAMQAPQPQAQPQAQTLPPWEQPKRPSELPPVAPRVFFQNGLLTVQAPNSTLTDILNGIHSKAGIQFEGSQGAFDRVAANFGPAPANEVLTELLRGSRFDYVILGSADGSDLVQRVILTPRAGTTAPGAVTAAQGQPQPKPQEATEGDEDTNGGEEQPAPTETVQPVVQPQVQTPPEQQQQPSDAPKTTEQLLLELKQMQQQQQQPQPNQEPSPLKTGVPNQATPPTVRPKVPQ